MSSSTSIPPNGKSITPQLPPSTQTQPKHLTQQALLQISGFTTMHHFMRSQRLRISNYEHYHRAQVLIEGFRQRLQLRWEAEQQSKPIIPKTPLQSVISGLPSAQKEKEQEKERKKGMEHILTAESALLGLGLKWEDIPLDEVPQKSKARGEVWKKEEDGKKGQTRQEKQEAYLREYLEHLTDAVEAIEGWSIR